MPITDPSPYQKAIFDYIKNGTGHLVVKAVAGSGKTTTSVESLRFIPPDKRTLFLAYNKSIASTLQTRVPSHVKASTFHSYGFSIVKQLYPAATMEQNKVYNAIQAISKANNWTIPEDGRAAFFARISRLVDLMRLTMRNDPKEIELLCAEFDIDNDDGEADYAAQAFGAIHADTTLFDFADMVYMPASRPFKTRGFDFVWVDEMQDLSEAQYQMARKLLAQPHGRLIVVGDPNQSIYGHSGAEPRLFDEVASLPGAITLPLSISYRCSKAVVAHAKALVPEIEANPAAPEGEVILDGSVKNVQDGDFVLCRINVPLVKLALQFIEQGRKATINGGDIGRSLITFLKPFETLSISAMEGKLQARLSRLALKLMAKFPYRKLDESLDYQRLTEKIATIEVLARDADSVYDITAKITHLFSDDISKGIVLSTIHKAKGLEADNVFILEPQLIPFPYYVTQEWQKQQERNIDYVARTRAIRKLEYIRDWTMYKKKVEYKSRFSKKMVDKEG